MPYIVLNMTGRPNEALGCPIPPPEFEAEEVVLVDLPKGLLSQLSANSDYEQAISNPIAMAKIYKTLYYKMVEYQKAIGESFMFDFILIDPLAITASALEKVFYNMGEKVGYLYSEQLYRSVNWEDLTGD